MIKIKLLLKMNKKQSSITVSKDFSPLSEYLHSSVHDAIYILVDENSSAACLPQLVENCEKLQQANIIEIESGEENKNIQTAMQLWEFLTNEKASRNSLWINVGGGVITDLGGFVASAYKRGISFINIPTTLLAQVDASVGGKTGVDFLGYKNQIGFFSLPELTYINPVFLNTLPKRQILSGFAEIIKHALIADKHYWNAITELTFSTFENWEKIINRSVEIKQSIVWADPLEKGQRKILNFGHTIGHALESWFLKSSTPILHGEAIAQGMIAEAYLSVKNNHLTEEEFYQIQQFIVSVYGRCQKFDIVEVLELMQQDKKIINGQLQFSLLNTIGNADYNCQVSTEDVIESLHLIQ
jgi:3-dehydroquinate synthase